MRRNRIVPGPPCVAALYPWDWIDTICALAENLGTDPFGRKMVGDGLTSTRLVRKCVQAKTLEYVDGGVENPLSLTRYVELVIRWTPQGYLDPSLRHRIGTAHWCREFE